MGWARTKEPLWSIVTIVRALQTITHFLGAKITFIGAILTIDVTIAQLLYRNAFIRFGAQAVRCLTYHGLIVVRHRGFDLRTILFIGLIETVWYAIATEEMWYTLERIGTAKFKGSTEVSLSQVNDMMIGFSFIAIHFVTEIQAIIDAVTHVRLVITADRNAIAFTWSTFKFTRKLIGVIAEKIIEIFNRI